MMSQHPVPTVEIGDIGMDEGEPTKLARAALEALNAGLTGKDAASLEACFYKGQAYWKDLLALTYHLRTISTPDKIASSLLETAGLRGLVGGFEIKGDAVFIRPTPVLQFIDCNFTFKTEAPAATCSGRILLLPLKVEERVVWKIWILSTKLENLDVQPEDETLLKAPGRQLNSSAPTETDVFIAGGGNAAAALAARLKALGVESIMAERNARVGDNWALRYDSLRFHVPTSFCELPFMTYDKELQSPHRLSKDELAGQLRRYVEAFHLNLITSAQITRTSRMPDNRWHIELRTPGGAYTVIAKHVVQATGVSSQKPYVPPIADEGLYTGISIHSTKFKNGDQLKTQGASSVLIVGSANTAFDLLEDCHAAGLKATMVVRSPTYIVPEEHVCDKLGLGVYDYGPVEQTDRMLLTLPAVVDAQLARGLFTQFASQEPERYAALAQAGFPVLDSRAAHASLAHHLIERGGGHYVDIGGTKIIAEGRADVKAGVEPVGYTTTGLRFSDGSTVDADAVVWCTGFADKDARATVAEVFQAAEEDVPVDATWGIDEEGEIRGLWKRQRLVDNFWTMGGYTQQHRYHSKTLAMQIKAALEGVLPPAYRADAQPA
ncbi:hypothetical protein F4778DRAFT_723448 [Xylariomycetidae sp. FL2044]|nr:hypothetical protein F4778DRAFT_723448 [Xylariomycetidae sp. FL2044]